MTPYQSVQQYAAHHRNGHVHVVRAFGPPRRHLTRHPGWATAAYVVLLPALALVLVGGAVTGTIYLLRLIRFLWGLA